MKKIHNPSLPLAEAGKIFQTSAFLGLAACAFTTMNNPSIEVMHQNLTEMSPIMIAMLGLEAVGMSLMVAGKWQEKKKSLKP